MADAKRDQNYVTSMLFVGTDGIVAPAKGDETTGRLYVDLAGGSGTVTSVSVVSANGFAGTVATATTTPAITLTTTITGILSGNGTAISAASTTGSGSVVLATSPTIATSLTGSYLTASEILITDGSKNIVSAPVATYPSLTELTYVKGVTSAIQTQLGTKQATITFGTGVQTALGVNIGSAGAPVLFNGALGTPSSGTVTNLTGTASININGTVGATTPTTGVFTTLIAGSTTSLLLGTAGSAVGNIGFRNATSGTITLAPVTGALGTVTLTLPAVTDTLVTLTASQTLTNKTLTAPTLGGTALFAEGGAIAYDSASSADGVYTGFVRAGTAGTTLAFGDLVYLASADSRWELADADAATTSDRFLGMCVLAAASDGDPTTILLTGFIRADAAFPAMTIGSAMFVGETPGDIQVAYPTGADSVGRRVGYAWTADELYFNPSMDSQINVA